MNVNLMPVKDTAMEIKVCRLHSLLKKLEIEVSIVGKNPSQSQSVWKACSADVPMNSDYLYLMSFGVSLG